MRLERGVAEEIREAVHPVAEHDLPGMRQQDD
jgi:hypothetical protein